MRGKLVVAVAGSRLSAIMPKESIGDCSTVECAAAAASAAASAGVAARLLVLVARCCPCAQVSQVRERSIIIAFYGFISFVTDI